MNFSIETSGVLFTLLATLGFFLPFLFQLYLGKRWKFPLYPWIATVVLFQTALILGSRIGGSSVEELGLFFRNGTLPDHGRSALSGILFALPVFFALFHFFRLPQKSWLTLLFSLPFGGVFARIGCFVAGCCYGTPTDMPWGVQFSSHSPAALAHGAEAMLHPVQLYMVLGLGLALAFTYYFYRRNWSLRRLFFLGFAVLTFQRFFVSFFRDVQSEQPIFSQEILGLSGAQWVTLMSGVILLGFASFARKKIEQEVSLGTSAIFSEKKAARMNLTALVVFSLCSLILWLVRYELKFLEVLALGMSLLVAWVWIFYRFAADLLREYNWQLSTSLVLSFSILPIAESLSDSIPVPRPGFSKKYIEVGGGWTGSSLKNVLASSGGCGGPVYLELENSSNMGGEIGLGWENEAKEETISTGLRLLSGSTTSSINRGINSSPTQIKRPDFYFGPYFSYQSKDFGINLNLMRNAASTPENSLGAQNRLHVLARIGKLNRFHGLLGTGPTSILPQNIPNNLYGGIGIGTGGDSNFSSVQFGLLNMGHTTKSWMGHLGWTLHRERFKSNIGLGVNNDADFQMGLGFQARFGLKD